MGAPSAPVAPLGVRDRSPRKGAAVGALPRLEDRRVELDDAHVDGGDAAEATDRGGVRIPVQPRGAPDQRGHVLGQ
eukprot:gene8703-biopygen8017